MPLQRDIGDSSVAATADMARAGGKGDVDHNLVNKNKTPKATQPVIHREGTRPSRTATPTPLIHPYNEPQQSVKNSTEDQDILQQATPKMDMMSRRDLDNHKIKINNPIGRPRKVQADEHSQERSNGTEINTRHRSNSQKRKQSPYDATIRDVFDDTSKLDYSFEDAQLTSAGIAVLNPPHQKQDRLMVVRDLDSSDDHNRINGFSKEGRQDVLPKYWQSMADEMREELGMEPRYTEKFHDRFGIKPSRDALDVHEGRKADGMPETPSREQTRLVPSNARMMQAPQPYLPHKQVNFAILPQIDSFGPESETVSELQDDMSEPQTQTEPMFTMPVHPRPPTMHDQRGMPQNNSPDPVTLKPQNRGTRFGKSVTGNSQEIQDSQGTIGRFGGQEQANQADQAGLNHRQGSDVVVQGLQAGLSSNKRRRETGLDYDPEILMTKKLDDLRRETFLHDPSAPVQECSTDPQGHLVALEQRLENLSQLSETDREVMFMQQSEDEWEKTGQWFIDKMQEKLKTVMQIRLKRRQTSLAFEDEIRRRQALVEHTEEIVTRELQELHDGGGALLKGREAGSRSGTPIKSVRG